MGWDHWKPKHKSNTQGKPIVIRQAEVYIHGFPKNYHDWCAHASDWLQGDMFIELRKQELILSIIRYTHGAIMTAFESYINIQFYENYSGHIWVDGSHIEINVDMCVKPNWIHVSMIIYIHMSWSNIVWKWIRDPVEAYVIIGINRSWINIIEMTMNQNS